MFSSWKIWVNTLNWFCLYSPITTLLHFVEFSFAFTICAFVYVAWVALQWKEKCSLVYFNFIGGTLSCGITFLRVSLNSLRLPWVTCGLPTCRRHFAPIWRLATAAKLLSNIAAIDMLHPNWVNDTNWRKRPIQNSLSLKIRLP